MKTKYFFLRALADNGKYKELKQKLINDGYGDLNDHHILIPNKKYKFLTKGDKNPKWCQSIAFEYPDLCSSFLSGFKNDEKL